MKTLLLGQAPSKTSDPAHPLTGGLSGTRLRELCRLTLKDYCRAFDRANLLPEWPGRSPSGGDRFPIEKARAAADDMRPKLLGRRVVLVGRGTAEAFGLRAPPLEWTRLPCVGNEWFWAAYLPHPSGLNHWWNEPANERAAAEFLAAEVGRGLE